MQQICSGELSFEVKNEDLSETQSEEERFQLYWQDQCYKIAQPDQLTTTVGSFIGKSVKKCLVIESVNNF